MIQRIHCIDDWLAEEILLKCLPHLLEIASVQRVHVAILEGSPALSVQVISKEWIRMGILARFEAASLSPSQEESKLLI